MYINSVPWKQKYNNQNIGCVKIHQTNLDHSISEQPFWSRPNSNRRDLFPTFVWIVIHHGRWHLCCWWGTSSLLTQLKTITRKLNVYQERGDLCRYTLQPFSKSEGSPYPVRTQRHFNVYTTTSQRYGRCIDVETTLCAYRVWRWNKEDTTWFGWHKSFKMLIILST